MSDDLKSRINNARTKLNTAKTPEQQRAAAAELEQLIRERRASTVGRHRPDRGVRG